MEVDKSGRSRSKTKEKERTKDDSKSRRSIEKGKKGDVETTKREKSKSRDTKKSSKTASNHDEALSKHKIDKIEIEAGKKKRAKDESSKERKSTKTVKDVDSSKSHTDNRKKVVDANRSNDSDKVVAAQQHKVAKGEPAQQRLPSAKARDRRGTVVEPEDEYNYEDDFEDYEDDFEEDDEDNADKGTARSGLERRKSRDQKDSGKRGPLELQISSDHSDVSTSRAATAASEGTAERRPKTIQSRINFEHAHVTEAQIASYSKIRGRAKDLRQLIELDTVSYDLFDMAPVRDYEFFMQNFGKSNMLQVQVQTGDDRIDREDQTDELDFENKWSQHPPTDIFACGGDHIADGEDNAAFRFDSEVLSSIRFRRFVERGGTLITELLADEYVTQEPVFQSKGSLSFSSGYSTTSIGSLAKKCSITAVTFAECQSTILAAAFYVEESPLQDILGKTLISVWNITHLETPYKLLVCDGRSQSCCLSPDRPNAVFAGLNDSSIVAWDLQESDTLHGELIPWKESEVALRKPTYDTVYLCKESSSEPSPVITVAAFKAAGKASGPIVASSTGDSYQLVCLHGDGSIRIWTALTTLSREPSELDLGLRPGGKLKLMQSALVKPPVTTLRSLCGNLTFKATDIGAFCLGWTADKPSEFYVGTDVGYVLRLTRHEGKSGPSVYQPYLEALTDVLCVSLSPFESSVLLAGCSDGCIRLYKTSHGRPITAFMMHNPRNTTEAGPVNCVQWSPISPYRFYSLHGASVLLTWDLKQDRQVPINIEKCAKPLLSFYISSCTALGSGPTNFVAMTLQDGSIEVHQLKAEGGKTKYTKSDGAKLLKLVEML